MTAIPSTDWSEYNLSPSEIVCKSTQIVVHKRTKDDWKIEQENDPVIGPVIEAMKNKSSNTSGFSDESLGIGAGCCSIVGYYTKRCLMVSCKKTNFSLFYQNLIGNNHCRLAMTIWVT